ncbi:hypothetical protein EVAR_17908_1 [Eumeta japonica]|uniref:Uncharacterized protein n=1 Tax=Eumeta variegata TaxID=151549 RepID=A0A4C1UYW2_EUMVA|nr:hypothetical protein EVAR_17908_1 [Eumeta japonica]
MAVLDCDHFIVDRMYDRLAGLHRASPARSISRSAMAVKVETVTAEETSASNGESELHCNNTRAVAVIFKIKIEPLYGSSSTAETYPRNLLFHNEAVGLQPPTPAQRVSTFTTSAVRGTERERLIPSCDRTDNCHIPSILIRGRMRVYILHHDDFVLHGVHHRPTLLLVVRGTHPSLPGAYRRLAAEPVTVDDESQIPLLGYGELY